LGVFYKVVMVLVFSLLNVFVHPVYHQLKDDLPLKKNIYT